MHDARCTMDDGRWTMHNARWTMKIEVADILAKRAPGKKIPSLVIRYLERLIHQKEINRLLQRFGNLRGYAFIEAVLRIGLDCDYTVHEEVPIFNAQCTMQNARCTMDDAQCTMDDAECTMHNAQCSEGKRPPVFVSNHPLGGLDGMVLALLLHEHGYDVKLIVNDLLMEIEPLRELMVPVNKIGGQKKDYVARMQALWESDSPILTFPAGACSRLIDGEVKDLPWKDTYLKKAKQYHRDIIPIYFDGRNSMHFYRVAQWRKWLHIPFNVEMLLLPDELFRQRKHHYGVYFSKPIPWEKIS